jgi:hypothetical protein
MYGKRVLEWTDGMEFLDRVNSVTAKITFADRGGLFTKAKQPSDFFNGSISVNDSEVATCTGSYLEGLQFANEEPIWELESCPVYKGISCYDPLPSDCRYREDMIYLGRGLQQMAEDYKLRLEVL